MKQCLIDLSEAWIESKLNIRNDMKTLYNTLVGFVSKLKLYLMEHNGVVFIKTQAHTTLMKTLDDDTSAIKKSMKHNSLLDDLHTSIIYVLKLQNINLWWWKADKVKSENPVNFFFLNLKRTIAVEVSLQTEQKEPKI